MDLTYSNTGMLIFRSGYIATFGMCDSCGREEYLQPGSYFAQERNVNSVCPACLKAKRGTGFFSATAVPDYRI